MHSLIGSQEIRWSPHPGLDVSSLPVAGSKFIHLTFTIRRGMELEQGGEFGYFSLLGTLLTRGCGALDRAEFALACDSRGANVNTYPGRDYLTIEFWVLPSDLEWSLQTLSDMIWKPKLESLEVELAVREHQLQLQARLDEKRSCLYDACREKLFGVTHHYGRPLLGVQDALQGASKSSLTDFHQRLVGNTSAILCVTGDFSQSDLEACLEKYFIKSHFALQERSMGKARFLNGDKESVAVPFPIEQAEVLVAMLAPCRWEADYRLGLFCNEILGGAFLSRLTRAVRMKGGMAYSADSRYRAALEAGVIWISLQTEMANVEKALSTVRAVMTDLKERGLEEEEFQHFREFVGCSMPFDYDSLSSLTSRRLEHILFGEPWLFSERQEQFQSQVQLDKTHELFQRLLQPDKALVAVLGQGVQAELGRSFHDDSSRNASVPALEVRPGPRAREKSGGPRAEVLRRSEHGELYRFPNGMHLLVLPRKDVASISLQLWTLTGSMDERPGKTGLSHLLEHLMFRGTKDFPDGSFDAILAQRGGMNNAFTTEDFTVYTDYLVPQGLEEALGLEADRLQNLSLTEDIFRTELSVVLEERSVRVTSSPLGTAYEQLQKLAFRDHPYAHPIIGWQNDLEGLTLADVREHYLLTTRPGRLLLVAAGGVKTAEVVELVERTFPISGEVSKSKWPVISDGAPVPKLEAANLRLERRSGYSYLLLCYRFPREGHPDYEACELLARIIGDGDSSRIYEKFVVQEQRFLEVWTSFESQAREHPLFHLGLASTEQFEHFTVAEQVIQFLADLKQHLTEAELKKARRSWLAEDAFLNDELEDWATEVAGRVMLMPWDDVWTDEARIKRVTLDDLKRVASRYLSTDGAVYVTLQGLSETESAVG